MMSEVYTYMLLLEIYSHHSRALTTTTWSANSDMENRRLPTNICVSETPSAVACAIECASVIPCMSYSYQTGDTICLLYSVPFTVDTKGEISEHGWTSYNMRSEICPFNLGYSYKRNLNMCYHLESEEEKQVTDAILFCASLKGHMLRIDTNEKQVFIAELLSSISSKSVYVGGVSENKDNLFSYEDGSPLTFFKWSPGRPDGKLAITMRKAHKYAWNNVDGISPKPFLCEITL